MAAAILRHNTNSQLYIHIDTLSAYVIVWRVGIFGMFFTPEYAVRVSGEDSQ